jgi:hypothetical protein
MATQKDLTMKKKEEEEEDYQSSSNEKSDHKGEDYLELEDIDID